MVLVLDLQSDGRRRLDWAGLLVNLVLSPVVLIFIACCSGDDVFQVLNGLQFIGWCILAAIDGTNEVLGCFRDPVGIGDCWVW